MPLMQLMKNMMLTLVLEVPAEPDNAGPAEYYLMGMELCMSKDIKDGAIIEPQNFPVIKDLIVIKAK